MLTFFLRGHLLWTLNHLRALSQLFHLCNNTVNAGYIQIFFLQIFFFNIQNYFLTLFHDGLFGHWLEHVLWEEKPDLTITTTADALAHPPKELPKSKGEDP